MCTVGSFNINFNRLYTSTKTLINPREVDTFFPPLMFLKLACTIPTAFIQLKINGASPPKMSKD
jgi:hypothetical protein